MRPIGIHHVSVNVSDMDAAIAFYTEVLGGTVSNARPDNGRNGAWIDIGGHQVHLRDAAVPANHGQHFAVLVDDLAAAVTELRSRGVAIGDPVPVGASLQAFVQDPDGNKIELHQASR